MMTRALPKSAPMMIVVKMRPLSMSERVCCQSWSGAAGGASVECSSPRNADSVPRPRASTSFLKTPSGDKRELCYKLIYPHKKKSH